MHLVFESPFYFDFAPLLVGVAFLAPVEVSFSTWFFYIFTRVQLLVTYFLGRQDFRGDFIPGHGSPWAIAPEQKPKEQEDSSTPPAPAVPPELTALEHNNPTWTMRTYDETSLKRTRSDM